MLKLLLATLLAAPVAFASTFVGNGGTPGDLELLVARNTVVDVLSRLASGKADEIRSFGVCTGEFERFKYCDTLAALSDEQLEYLRELAGKNAAELLAVFEENRLSHRWTEDRITVKENGGLRGADAVIDRQSMVLTINKARFLEMTPSERIFLLAHEAGHLAKVQGKFVDDDQPVGPFKNAEGGRELLNAFGSAAAQASIQNGTLLSYVPKLNRSQSWKKYWVGLKTSGKHGGNGTNSAFANEHASGGGFMLRYQFTPSFGALLDLQGTSTQRKVLDTIDGVEQRSAAGVGLAYRIFFTEDPLSQWAQHHLVLEGLYKRVSGTYKYSEGIFSDSDTAEASTWGANVRYYFPLQKNFWLDIGAGAEGPTYSYTKIRVQNTRNSALTELGVTYAF